MNFQRDIRALMIALVACCVTTWTARAEDTCYVAKAESPNPNINYRGSATFVLNEDVPQITYNVICCGACHPEVAIYSTDEGLLFFLVRDPSECPADGVWNMQSPVPLTTDRIQDLKDGKLELRVYDRHCAPDPITGTFVADPCEREAPPEFRAKHVPIR